MERGKGYGEGEIIEYALNHSSLFILFMLSRVDWNSKERRKKLVLGFILSGIAIYATYPMFTNTLQHADDLFYHLLRIEGIKDGLLDGQFPVIIFPEALEGNGLLNSMYPSIFLYIPTLLRIARVSLVTSYKFYIFLVNIATVGVSFFSVKSIYKSDKAVVMFAFLYTLCPYRFTNIYARGAMGEVTAMIFFPLLFVGLYHLLVGKKEKWYYTVIAMTGLLQTHILSILLAGIIAVIFGLIYIVKIIKEKRYIEVIKAILGFGILNLRYLIPFTMFYLWGSLWMSSLDWSTFEEYAVTIFSLMQTINLRDFRNYTLGIALFVCIAIAVFYVIVNKIKSEKDKFLFKVLILGGICTYMTTNFFSGWALIGNPLVEALLLKIQFPWRLLALSSCIFAMIGMIWFFEADIYKEYRQLMLYILIVLALLPILKTIDAPVYATRNSTVSEGHIRKVIGLPYNKARNNCYPYDWRLGGSNNDSIVSQPVLSDEEKVEIFHYQKDGTHASYSYITQDEGEFIEVPLLAYKGYVARDENGNKVKIYKESDWCNRIRICLSGDGQKHSINIKYRGYWFMDIANAITLIALFFALWKGRQNVRE